MADSDPPVYCGWVATLIWVKPVLVASRDVVCWHGVCLRIRDLAVSRATPGPGVIHQLAIANNSPGVGRTSGPRPFFPDEATSGYRMKGFGFRDHPSPRLQSRAVRRSRSDSSAHLNPGRDRRSDHDLLETGGRRLPADPLSLRQGVTGTTVAAALRMKRTGRSRVADAPPITRVRQDQAPSPPIRVNSPQ